MDKGYGHKLYQIMLYRVHLTISRVKPTKLVVIGTEWTGSCIFNYHTITITTTMAFWYFIFILRGNSLTQMMWGLIWHCDSHPNRWRLCLSYIILKRGWQNLCLSYIILIRGCQNLISEKFVHMNYCQNACKWVSECVLFNTNSAIFQLYCGENKLIFNEMMMRSALF